MGPDPAPPPVILAIPAPSPPPSPSSLSSNRDPTTLVSDQPSSPPDRACSHQLPAPPSPVLSGPAPASSATPAIQGQRANLSLPADLLCFQSLLPSSTCFEPPSSHQFSAAPEPPPAALSASAEPSSSSNPSSLLLPLADAHLDAQPAVPQQCSHPVRGIATATTASEPLPVVSPETAAPPSSDFPPLLSSASKRHPLAETPIPAIPADILLRPQPVRRNAQANPLHPKSYAQAAKGSPGPGFVRAHAREVESFARLPRTGINVIRGSRDGIPTFAFVQSEMTKVEGLYAKALVMKFHGGRPSLAASHKEISGWGFESSFSIGPLTSRSYLLRFQDERDLLKTLTRPASTLSNYPYNIFRWHNRCHEKEDSSTIPIWISLPRLPLQCFAPEFLESIANTVGRFLCLDKATATLARPSEARMCVELDLRKERLQFIWIDLFEGFKQPIVYERVPKFCIGCHAQGHTHVECSKVSLDTPQPLESGPLPAPQERTQSVRQNAEEILPAVNHFQSPPLSAAAPTLLAAVESPLQDPTNPSLQQRHSPSSSISSQQQTDQSLQYLSDPSQQHFDPPSTSTVALYSVQQHTRSISPADPAVSAAPQQFPAPQPNLQSAVEAETLLSAPHLPAPCIPPSKPDQPADYPLLQSSLSEALQQHLAQSQTTAKASTSFSSIPDAEEPPDTSGPHPADAHPNLQSTATAESHPTHPPLPSKAVASSSSQVPAAAATPYASDPHPSSAPPQPSVVQQAGHPSNPPPAAVRNTVLSAIAAPFPYSDPVQSSQQSSPLNYQQPSLLPIYINSNGATYITSLPQKSLPIGYAPNPYFTHRSSLETDSQQNSPSGSPLKDVNKCIFPSQSCVSEGEELIEDHPGFQGHNSDVDFYQRPRSSKKNKRQPDGPLRVHLRARKGLSSRK